MEILVQRLVHGADLPLPGYATAGAAGMDLLAAVAEAVVLPPGARALIPTGLRIALPAGYEMQIRPARGWRCGTASCCPTAPARSTRIIAARSR